jgi:hypothetical protein
MIGDTHAGITTLTHVVADLAISGVVPHDDRQRKVLGDRRGQVAEGEEKPAVADDDRAGTLRIRKLGADRRRHCVAEGAVTHRKQPGTVPVAGELDASRIGELGRVRGDEGLPRQSLPQGLEHPKVQPLLVGTGGRRGLANLGEPASPPITPLAIF